jgi:hypothetical protein
MSEPGSSRRRRAGRRVEWCGRGDSFTLTGREASGRVTVDALERHAEGVVRKGGLEPPRPCGHKLLRPRPVTADQSRPRKVGVGCPASFPTEVI